MKCYIVKDLLPIYIDKLTNEDANTEIDMHLKDCSNCRAEYEHMLFSAAQKEQASDKDIDFLKKLKSIIQQNYASIIFLTCALWIGFVVFAKNFNIPIPYEKDQMTTETYQAAAVTNSQGLIQWDDVDLLDFETTKAVISEGYDLLNLVQLVRKEAPGEVSIDSYGRTIYRDGKKVKVVYYCYTKTLWDKLFLNGKEVLSAYVSTGDIYGNSLYHKNYEPQMREIYYLPIRNLSRLEKLSDDEFDAQRENAVFVWGGVV